MLERKITIPHGYVLISQLAGTVPVSDMIHVERTDIHPGNIPYQPSQPYSIFVRAAQQSSGAGEWLVYCKADFVPHSDPSYTVAYTGESAHETINQESHSVLNDTLQQMVHLGMQEAHQHATCGGSLTYRIVLIHPVDYRLDKYEAAAKAIIHLTQLNPFNTLDAEIRILFAGLR